MVIKFNCDNIAAYKEKVIQTLINQKNRIDYGCQASGHV